MAKYTLWLVGILLLASACISGASMLFQRQSLTQEAILRGESIALNLAGPAADAYVGHDTLLLVSLATGATRDNQGVVYAALLDTKGLSVGHPDFAALYKPLSFQAVSPLLGKARKATVVAGLSGDQRVWDISVPVASVSGKVLGSAHVGLAQSVVESAVYKALLALAAISLGVLAVAVVLTYGSLRVLVHPLTDLAHAADAVGKGKLDVQVTVRSQDEVGRLASNFNAMVSGLKAAANARVEQGRIERELELARFIQSDLLLSVAPDIPGLEIAFNCLPAKELGGDFYDCFKLDGGKRWAFLIADVSGKGVPAALHMANLRNMFRVLGPQSNSPLVTVKKVNDLAYQDMKGGAFVTLIYAIWDPEKKTVKMVNAGHDPAFRLRGVKMESYRSTAPPVGLAPAEDYDDSASEMSFSLAKGDLFFTYTDGVTEAMNEAGEQFNLERLQASLAFGGTALAATGRLMDAVRAHAQGFEQSDDITMLAAKVG